MELIIGILLAGGVGVGAFFLGQYIKTAQLGRSAQDAERIISEAETKKKELLIEARDEALKVRDETEKELKERRAEMQKYEKKLESKEEAIERRQEMFDKKLEAIDEKTTKLQEKEKEIEEHHEQAVKQLQKVAEMSKEEARQVLLDEIEGDVKEEAMRLIREVEAATREEADKRAADILAVAMQRLAADVVTDSVVYAIHIPSDDMKGRIIGREGRNIRTLEQLTGVTFTIDDTPETIIISCFDPIRREVARLALESLVKDGRIHPARIEEAVQKAKKEVSQEIKEAGEQAILDAGISGAPKELVKLLGRLKYRTSYGQNVLHHSVEVARLGGLLASELKINVTKAKTACLFHDIGKAVDHEVEGGHAMIGKEILDRFDFPEDVTYAVGAHHEDLEVRSALDHLVIVADSLSASRPGARFDTKEDFIQRVIDIENLANGFEGVKQSYALQAGREVRVIVDPTEVDDLSNIRMCRDIATKIEENLKYPGQIKVVAIRETRAIELAK